MTERPTGRADAAYDALVDEARAAFRRHDVREAESVARQALARDPRRGEAYNLLAAVRASHGEAAEAMDMLRAAIAVDPTYAPARENLARVSGYPHRGAILLGDEDCEVERDEDR